jgi:DNA-binding CsgD family transcriptional regulator
VVLNDAESAGRERATLERHAGTIAIEAATVAGWSTPVSVDRLLGSLAYKCADETAARRHYENAIVFCRESGCAAELAWTCRDYSRLLVASAAAADVARATELVAEGSSSSSALRMSALESQLLALGKELSGLRGGKPTYPDGLTEREVEVLRLLAAGKSNREIAEALFISPNTVIRHVSNIFSKTRAANRTEAATYAHRHGLSVDGPGKAAP